ncbi:MAG: hypothetical protein ACE14P_04710 [Methanotrichaceae archaeon]
MRGCILAFLMMIAIVSNANSVYWSSSVDTNSSHWYIYRQSDNLSFSLSSSVEGKISPVEFHGRALTPYQSYNAEIGMNDVRLRERTSALEGNYRSNDEIEMQSENNANQIDITVDKPAGTNVYAISYNNEQWPVIIKVDRTIEYSGKQINDRTFEGNNGDYVGVNFLNNRELYTNQRIVMWLQRFNATVMATNDSILLAKVEATKYLGYIIQAHTEGIADLSYRQRDPQYDIKHQVYPALNEGEERYYGTYNLARKIEMGSVFKNSDIEDDWLPCCCGGLDNMTCYDKNGYGDDPNNIFNCRCYRPQILK